MHLAGNRDRSGAGIGSGDYGLNWLTGRFAGCWLHDAGCGCIHCRARRRAVGLGRRWPKSAGNRRGDAVSSFPCSRRVGMPFGGAPVP